jgi:glucoamylase
MASLRALQAGSRLAERLNDSRAAEYYHKNALGIASTLEEFWHEDERSGVGYWKASIVHGQGYSRTGLDCAIPLTAIHTGGDSTGKDILLAAGGSEVLASIREYALSFKGLYPINQAEDWTDGWAVGRYMEDIYDGVGSSQANPW